MIGKVFQRAEGNLGHLIPTATTINVATIAAAMPEPHGRNAIAPVGSLTRVSGSGTVAGQAITVWNPGGNNTMLRFGIHQTDPGYILVVSCPSGGAAQWGDIASATAAARGATGVIIDGDVRDLAEIRETGLSVWARSVDPRQADKEVLGYVNGPITVAGLTVRPGDLVVADDDAVMFIPADQAESAVANGVERGDTEDKIREDSRQGKRSPLLPEWQEDKIEIVDQTWVEWSAQN